MQIDKYTDRLKALIQSAQSLALRQGHQQFTPLHLLKALLDDEDRLAASLIEASGGRVEALRQSVEGELAKLPRVEGAGAGQIHMGPETARVFDQAEQLAQRAGDSFVTVEYLLLAMAMASGTKVADLIRDAGVTPQALNQAIADLRKGRQAESASAEDGSGAMRRSAAPSRSCLGGQRTIQS